MLSLLIAFFASFIATTLIIRSQKLHARISGDFDFSGPQKFHLRVVPRIGGLSICLGIYLTIAEYYLNSDSNSKGLYLALSSLPVFGIGIAEDLFKNISIRIRFLFIAFGALMAIILLDVSIHRIDILVIDYLLASSWVSVLFTIFAITGLTNAYNIIDGFNGLSSMIGMITLMAIGYMAIQFNDPLIIFLSFTMVSAILGFFIFNYPRGLIFLGDGGAYLIGFFISILTISLVYRHSEISPWFAVMINAYPILETLFTMYRRIFHQGKSPGHPDGLHFHSLIFRRILNPTHLSNELEWFKANAKTSPYLWILSSLAIVPAIFFWQSTPILISFLLAFIIAYIWVYKRLVNFRTPSWMHL